MAVTLPPRRVRTADPNTSAIAVPAPPVAPTPPGGPTTPTPGRFGRLFAHGRADLPASIVVFLVALPLCLGIALASGAPMLSGLVAGVVGGIVVGAISGSPLMVSGPAAGLTAIVVSGIAQVGGFSRFLPAVLLGGALQLALGAARAGVVAYYIPSSVIKGMLAAIGLTLILKQIPHAVGYDRDYEGDFSFIETDGSTTFSAIGDALGHLQPGALVIGALGLFVLALWPRTPFARVRLFPAPLAVVVLGVVANEVLKAVAPWAAVRPTHLVRLPTEGPAALLGQLARPDWAALGDHRVWMLGLTLGIVASLESLLSLEATNKLDPWKREPSANRELVAQGVGNMTSALLGGLPVTGVIVRSSANVDAGARTRLSAIVHGLLLVVAVVALPLVLNRIPLAALAAVLLFTGYKLAQPALWRAAWRIGPAHFVPFAITIVAILFTNLLVGIGIGLVVGVAFVLYEHMRRPVLHAVSPPGAVLSRYALPDHLTFLDKANIAATLEALPPNSRIEVDGRNTRRFDYDALEALLAFRATARSRNIDYRLVGVPEVETTPAH